MAVARTLLRGASEAAGPELQDAARLFGLALPDEVLRPAGPDIEVWAENWPAVRLFTAMWTQLRTSGMNGRVEGFDYTALPVVERRIGLRRGDRRRAFEGLQTMERELIEHYNA